MRVLVVDDERRARERLSRLLEAYTDIEVAGEAEDGLSALETIGSVRPDAVFLDVQMPGLDGFEVLKWLRTQNQDDIAATPVIIISSSDSQADVREAYKLGANFYLTKPLNWVTFSERIRLLGMVWGDAETLKHG